MHQVLLVTGDLTGLGGTLALAAAREGATIVVADWQRQPYDELRPFLELFGQESGYVPLSNSDGPHVRQTLTAVEQQFGRVDIVLNCPAIAYQAINAHRFCTAEACGYARHPVLADMLSYLPEEARLFGCQGGIIVNLIPFPRHVDWAKAIAYRAAVRDLQDQAVMLAEQLPACPVRVNTLSPCYRNCPQPGRSPLMARLADAEQEIQAFLTLITQETPPCNGIHWQLPAGR